MQSKQSGFTLIELLVVMVITVILGGGLLGLQYILSTNQVTVWRNVVTVEEANSSVSQLLRELRNARDGDNGAYTLATANDQEIVFFADYDLDGVTERMHYHLTGTTLSRGIVEPTGFPPTYDLASEVTKVLSDNVRNGTTPIFYYYNSSWPSDTTTNPLAQASRLTDTRLVEVKLAINTQDGEPDKDYILDSFAQIRQLSEHD